MKEEVRKPSDHDAVLIPVKGEGERRRVGKSLRLGRSAQKVVASPVGYSGAQIAQLEGSHIVPKEPDSRIPAYFHHWLWAAWGDCVLRLI